MVPCISVDQAENFNTQQQEKSLEAGGSTKLIQKNAEQLIKRDDLI
jgi:hypothetical protein